MFAPILPLILPCQKSFGKCTLNGGNGMVMRIEYFTFMRLYLIFGIFGIWVGVTCFWICKICLTCNRWIRFCVMVGVWVMHRGGGGVGWGGGWVVSGGVTAAWVEWQSKKLEPWDGLRFPKTLSPNWLEKNRARHSWLLSWDRSGMLCCSLTLFVLLAAAADPPREIAFSLLLVGEQREVREAKTILSFCS